MVPMKGIQSSTGKKNPAAVALGKLRAASITPEERTNAGNARAKSLSKARRRQIAQEAARARWAKGKKAGG